MPGHDALMPAPKPVTGCCLRARLSSFPPPDLFLFALLFPGLFLALFLLFALLFALLIV